MSDSKGIQNIKDVVKFGFVLGKVGKDIFAGGFHADKLGELITIYPAAQAAIEGFGEVLPEIKDLSAEEAPGDIAISVVNCNQLLTP